MREFQLSEALSARSFFRGYIDGKSVQKRDASIRKSVTVRCIAAVSSCYMFETRRRREIGRGIILRIHYFNARRQ